MGDEITESSLKQKDWVDPSDEIEQRGGSSFFEWRNDSYHAFDQMQQVISDPDVQICDVERDDGQVVVNLQATDEFGPDEYPVRSLSAMSELASTRFSGKQDDPEYGAWDEEEAWWHLNRVLGQTDDAMGEIDDGNELEAKEQIADAMNYLLFAYDTIDGNDT